MYFLFIWAFAGSFYIMLAGNVSQYNIAFIMLLNQVSCFYTFYIMLAGNVSQYNIAFIMLLSQVSCFYTFYIMLAGNVSQYNIAFIMLLNQVLVVLMIIAFPHLPPPQNNFLYPQFELKYMYIYIPNLPINCLCPLGCNICC